MWAWVPLFDFGTPLAFLFCTLARGEPGCTRQVEQRDDITEFREKRGSKISEWIQAIVQRCPHIRNIEETKISRFHAINECSNEI